MEIEVRRDRLLDYNKHLNLTIFMPRKLPRTIFFFSDVHAPLKKSNKWFDIHCKKFSSETSLSNTLNLPFSEWLTLKHEINETNETFKSKSIFFATSRCWIDFLFFVHSFSSILQHFFSLVNLINLNKFFSWMATKKIKSEILLTFEFLSQFL